ncbi:MAG: hypothetical protein VX874_02620 [Pseudomonadota bacterium]|nr:hypothetical protein [Pseudomonadota bacterium]
MGKTNGKMLAFSLALMAILLGGASILKGAFYLGKHEGDTLHLLQMVLRMAEGDWPHLDFVTPIGVLAIAPIAWLVSLGLGAGHAILWSQVIVAAVALPATWYVAKTRFQGPWSYVFGAVILILILALVHGETTRAVSISMHYNRWAWAAAFLAIATAVMPAQGGNRTADGVVIGVAMAFLLLTKATYLIAFLPAVLVALIGQKAWRTVGFGLVAGVAALIAVTVLAGTPLVWLAYLRDLATVAASDVRTQPGYALGVTVGAPAWMGGSLMLILSVIWLRHAGRMHEGLVMLILVPGFFYVTYQNFGNDPQWLPLLGLMLIALRPEAEVRNGFGWNMREVMTYTAVGAFAFGAPSLINLAYSPFRHLTEDPETYTALIPGSGRHEDILTPTIRAHRVDAKVAMDGPDTIYARFWNPEFREGEVTEWRGEVLPNCTAESGTVAWFQTNAEMLAETGLIEGKTAFVADLLNAFWLYGAFEPLPGNAPWYYGGLTGLKSADYVVVPLCPLSVTTRHLILGELEAAEVGLTEAVRTSEFILYDVD